MQVFNDDQEWLSGSQLNQKLRQGLKQPPLFLFGINCTRDFVVRGREFRQQPREIERSRINEAFDLIGGKVGEETPQ